MSYVIFFRQISNQAIFSLFLSTIRRFHLFFLGVTVSSDSSNWVRNDSFHTLDPIMEISFDVTAYASPAGAVALDQVVLDLSPRSSIVRCMTTSVIPLLTSSLLPTGVDSAHVWTPWTTRMRLCFMDLMKALEGELLDGPTVLQVLKYDRSSFLACLPVRFALEFDADGKAGDLGFM